MWSWRHAGILFNLVRPGGLVYTLPTTYFEEDLMTLVLRLCLGVLLLTPGLTPAAVLENPGQGLSYSGIGVISGWKCEAAGPLTVRFNGGAPIPLLYGSERGDTAGVCGDTNNGYVAIWNWAELGEGTGHTAVVYENGVEFAQSTFSVATLGEPFVRGANGQCTIPDFPAPGGDQLFAWNQATQHLELVRAGSGRVSSPLQAQSALTHAAALENPGQGLSYSGIGVISGWKCAAAGPLTVRFNGGAPIPLLYGSERGDTSGVCGDTNNGYVAIWNWAELGEGTQHTAVVYENGVEFAQSTFSVATLGEPFVRGASGGCTLADFPAPGERATFAWNQATQHLELAMSGRASALDFPLRALHTSGNWGTNDRVVEQWEAAGRTGPLIPPDYIAWLKSLHVNWIGLSVGLHYDDSMDSTVERVYSGVDIPTYADAALRQMIREFRSHGINVYLTLAFEANEASTAARPLHRLQLGDPGHAETGVPPDTVFEVIQPEFWPWRPDHPDHQRFVAEFWETYTQQAVHFARLAEEEGVRLYSLGTETDRLFRTRSGGSFPNDFGQELRTMVARVRAVYSGLVTYDMYYDALTSADFYGPGSNHLWEDLDLDIVGISAYFPLTDSPPSTVLSVAALQASYEQIFQDYLLPLAARNPGRPLVFLEYGAMEAVESPYDQIALFAQPFVFSDANGNGKDDGRETQANVYQALFNTMAQHPGVLNGVFFWGHWMASDAMWERYGWKDDLRSFSIRGKPAEEVVRSAYESYQQQ